MVGMELRVRDSVDSEKADEKVEEIASMPARAILTGKGDHFQIYHLAPGLPKEQPLKGEQCGAMSNLYNLSAV